MILLREQIFVLAVLLVLSGIFSMSETAITSVNKLRIMHLAERKRKGAASLLGLKERPTECLTAILIVNNLVNVAATVLATSIALQIFQDNAIAYATGIMTLLILVFGEITPKSLATTFDEKIALFVAKPISLVTKLCYPLVWVFNCLTSTFTKHAPVVPEVTEAEIKSIIEVGHEEGEIDAGEREMIHRIFKFDDMTVSQVMVPRRDIVSIEASNKVSDLIMLLKKRPFSRIPVHEKSKDNIVGVVFTKDVINVTKKQATVKSIMERISFVPETQELDTLLRQFKKKRQSIAIVLDEHGSLSGLVTVGDLVDEIIGEIVDEKEKVEPNITALGKGTWMVEGKTDIMELNEKIKSSFKDDVDYETVGGFIIHKLNKIPQAGDGIASDRFKLTVDKIEGKRITKVRIEKK